MATCESGALKSIFEIVCIAGGLGVSDDEIITATSSCAPRLSISALSLSSGDIFIYCHKDGRTTAKLIPWSRDDVRRPAALAFSPTSEWLLVATDDGCLYIIPIGKFIDGMNTECDHRFPTNDTFILQPNGSRAKPTAIVWWQTLSGDSSLAIIGTELGELCFVELISGKDVGGTYITVPVRQLHLCRDNSLDTVYLLITGTEDRQWRLVLEQKSSHYLFPLENISQDWGDEETHLLGSSLQNLSATTPTPRSRLMGLKQLSVEKLQLLKQRLSEAKHSSKKKPLTENKGVDTCDLDDLPNLDSNILISQTELSNSCTSTTLSSKPTTPATEALDSFSNELLDNSATISTRPERLDKYIYDVVATPQYAKERYLLAGHYKPNSSLMVYSTDLENTPLFVFKLPADTKQIVLHDELIFVTSDSDSSKLTIISTFFSASSKINGEIDNSIDPVLQDIRLKEGEEILHIFPSPPFINRPDYGDTSNSVNEKRDVDSDNDECSEVDAGLPSHTKPNGCLIVTKSSLYLCQPRKSIESLFMELTLRSGDVEAANKLGVIFSLDTKLFELAADAKLRNGCFAAAISLYKHSRCPHVKCALKFAWTGFIPEFLTYMTSLTNGPDLGIEQRKHLATLAVLAHLHQLSLPAGVRSLQQQQTTLKNLLLLLRSNNYYDENLTLVLAAATWRWETLQYLASSRGLLLEKLHALLSYKYSPVIASMNSSCAEDKAKSSSIKNVPMCRDRETGFLHCISDPEFRGVILYIPSLARRHMAFVLDNLDSFDISVLRRLTSVYDPTQPAIQPFISSSSYFQKPNIYIQNLNANLPSSSFLPPASDDPIGMDTLTQVFLAILIKLNQKRGWKYRPELLSIRPIELKKKEPFFDTYIHRRILACGYGHSAVAIDGAVYSWGLGEYGVLGHGPKSSTSSPLLQGVHYSLCEELEEIVHLQKPPAEFTFNSQAVKSEVSTPLSEANEIDCCEPRAISYLKNFKVYSLACGKSHMLAITDYGVYGWGNSRNGQVGTGYAGRYPRPILIQSLVHEEVIVIGCGQFHSLAVTADGRLFTWGWGVHGQLGHKNVEDCLKPKQVLKLKKKKIVQAAGGYAHSVALTSKGVVYAWGCSTYGQVGTGGIVKVTSPAMVPINNVVKLLTAGYFHNIAVSDDHIVYTWGSNPACLRVQAQIQRKNRYAENQRSQEANNIERKVKENNSLGEQSEDDKEINDLDNREDKVIDSEDLVLDESISQGLLNDSIKLPDDVDINFTKETCDDLQVKHANTVCQKSPCHLIVANTVPSCDPLELGHLLPKVVEMPYEYGVVKSIAAGNQHSLLLTTHGSLYSWGRNMSGQLGTGNRRESLTPVRILDDSFITEIACGADFNLALETHGHLWGWGSNFYSQLGHGGGCGEEKGQPGKVFMLRTSKRVLKVPHSVQSNVETPRTVANLPLSSHSMGKIHQYSPHLIQQTDLNNRSILSGVQLSKLESSCEELSEKEIIDDKDDGLYGTVTLHAALSLLHPHYTPKTVEQMLLSSNGHQALATLYTLERQHRKAMHHQLCALLSHALIEEAPGNTETSESKDLTSIKTSTVEAKTHNLDEKQEDASISANVEPNELSESHSIRIVNEAVRILDHYLRLQTEESQSGMRGVLQEGIGLWLTHSLPIPQLEDLLLTHLPRTVYPLALLLFGDENLPHSQNVEPQENVGIHDEPLQKELDEETTKVLSRLSTKFCLNLCSSVISHLQTGECNLEQLDALSQLVKVNQPSQPKDSSLAAAQDSEFSPYNTLIDSLSKNSPDAINLSPEDVSALKMANIGIEDDKKLKRVDDVTSEESATTSKSKKEQSKRKSLDKDCVLFTCGHHFTTKDFKLKVLPQLEKTVTTVPGLLGKTARVLLDQYHSDQPQMACPHCVLAHLTIKLTKHNQPSPS